MLVQPPPTVVTTNSGSPSPCYLGRSFMILYQQMLLFTSSNLSFHCFITLPFPICQVIAAGRKRYSQILNAPSTHSNWSSLNLTNSVLQLVTWREREWLWMIMERKEKERKLHTTSQSGCMELLLLKVPKKKFPNNPLPLFASSDS